MRRELIACALLLALAAFRWWAWQPPAGRTRAEFVELLVAAERSDSTPRREALRRGWSDEELGRAAHHWGDLATEEAVAARLERASPRP
jgi:hypothetical protein